MIPEPLSFKRQVADLERRIRDLETAGRTPDVSTTSLSAVTIKPGAQSLTAFVAVRRSGIVFARLAFTAGFSGSGDLTNQTVAQITDAAFLPLATPDVGYEANPAWTGAGVFGVVDGTGAFIVTATVAAIAVGQNLSLAASFPARTW